MDENLKSRKSKPCKVCSSKPQNMTSRGFGRLKVIEIAPSKRYISPDSPDENGSIPAWFGPISAPAATKKIVVSGDHLHNQGSQSCGYLCSKAAKQSALME